MYFRQRIPRSNTIYNPFGAIETHKFDLVTSRRPRIYVPWTGEIELEEKDFVGLFEYFGNNKFCWYTYLNCDESLYVKFPY